MSCLQNQRTLKRRFIEHNDVHKDSLPNLEIGNVFFFRVCLLFLNHEIQYVIKQHVKVSAYYVAYVFRFVELIEI